MFARKALLFLLVVAVVVAAWAKATYFPAPSARTAYQFTAFFFAAVGVMALLVSSMASERSRRARRVNLDKYIDNRRETFRIPYPEDERPKLLAESDGAVPGVPGVFEVLDVSEEGVRFRADLDLEPGHVVRGEVVFPTGRRARVEGTVVRRDGDQVSLRLRRTVPGSIIVEETRRLRSHLKPGA